MTILEKSYYEIDEKIGELNELDYRDNAALCSGIINLAVAVKNSILVILAELKEVKSCIPK